MDRVAAQVVHKNLVKELLTQRVTGQLPTEPYDGSIAARAQLHGFASGIIHSATSDIAVNEFGILVADPQVYILIEVLTKLTEYYVIDGTLLGSAQRGQGSVLIELVASLWSWAQEQMAAGPDERLTQDRRAAQTLPPKLHDYIEIAGTLDTSGSNFREVCLRGVVDYVASMTDAQASAYHDRMTKGYSHSMLDPWLFV